MKLQIIVCGLERTGYKIFCLLRQQGAKVVGISSRTIPGERNNDIIIGDLRSSSTLISAGIKQAHTIVLASNDDALNLSVLTQARVLNPRIRIINRLYNQTLGDRLDSLLRDHLTMSVSSLVAPIFTFAALGDKAIGQLRLFDRTWPIQEEIVDQNHPWLGKPLNELWNNRGRMLIYYLPARGEIDLVSAVVKRKKLQLGDRLIIANKPTFRPQKRSQLSKLFQTFTNLPSYQHYARPVTAVSLSLLATIFVATFTYVCFNFNTSIVDALYFSVGMITGAGGQETVVEQAPDSIKIFTALMMLVGAGIIGICYALLNDFILGSRLRQLWDAAKVPSGNHYIVCGLGAIGKEIVTQLQSQGHEVVVIEKDANNRFLYTVRSLGVPLILEDASLAATLKAAHIQTAEALIAVTSLDMVNVEIGLTAKALAPKLSVILSIQEPQWADSVQEVFQFETVLSPTELASHSFAAAALGGKILGNGVTKDLLWIALGTLITLDHPFCGKIVRDAARKADFVPLYIESEGETIHGWYLLKTRLQPGDVLYLTMPANSLEQIWHPRSLPKEMTSQHGSVNTTFI
jgi:Trk K+ transport system NAD-binding subunit